MERYFWREHENRPLETRFPADVRGREAWLGLLRAAPQAENQKALGEAFDDFLEAIDQESQPRSPTCCVFVSHRKHDLNNALHVAGVADQCGYDVWLDVYDPKLQAVLGRPIQSPGQEILIAAIIEIGLLNATHIIALHTKLSPGSQSIPYELGRAKARAIRSDQAAGWYYPAALGSSPAEYMRLVEATTTDAEIAAWLSHSGQPWPGRPMCALLPETKRRLKPEDVPPPLDPHSPFVRRPHDNPAHSKLR